MRITKEEIKKLEPCKDGYEWYLKNSEEDLLTLLLKLNEFKSAWASWLFLRRMSLNQRRAIAIFSAEQVIDIFELKYPTDKRPRLAIEAAKNVLVCDNYDNRRAAADASHAACAAAYDAYTDAAYDAAYDAACAAVYAAYTDGADAAYDAACAAAYAANAASGRKEMQVRIIKEAVRILEFGDPK